MQLSDLRGPVISGIRWTASARLLSQVVTWSATVAAVRILSPSDYGIVGVATLLSGYLAMLGDVGFGSAIIQRQVRDSETLNAIFSVFFLSGLLLGAVTFFSAPIIARMFHEPEVASVARLVAVQFPLGAFAAIPEAQLRMQLRFRELGIANVCGSFVSAAAVVCMALLHGGPFALVGAMLLNLFARIFVLSWFAKVPVKLTLNLRPTRSLLRYSGLIVAERSAWYWYSEADGAFVGKILGANALGIFSLAKNIIQAPLDRLSEVLNAVSFPAYSRIQQHSEAVVEAYIKAIRMGGYIVFSVFWGLGSVAGPLIHVAFGDKWLPAVLPLQLLSIAMPLRAVQYMSTPLMHGIGRPDVTMMCTVTALAIILPSIYFGVSYAGLPGAAGAWACGYPIVFAISSWLFTKALGINALRVWIVLARPALCGAVMAAIVIGTIKVLGIRVAPALTLVAAIAAGAGTYAASMALIDNKAFKELLGLFGSLAGKKPKTDENALPVPEREHPSSEN